MTIERGERSVIARIERARDLGVPVVVPAGCLAQVWRAPSRQVRLSMLLKLAGVVVASLDNAAARQIGVLLAVTGTSDGVDAHVAVIATKNDATVYTSDPEDLLRLAPRARIQAV